MIPAAVRDYLAGFVNEEGVRASETVIDREELEELRRVAARLDSTRAEVKRVYPRAHNVYTCRTCREG